MDCREEERDRAAMQMQSVTKEVEYNRTKMNKKPEDIEGYVFLDMDRFRKLISKAGQLKN